MRSLMMSLSVAAQPVRDWMRDQAMHPVVMTSPVIPIESFCQSWHEMGSLTQEYIMMRVYCLSLVAVLRASKSAHMEVSRIDGHHFCRSCTSGGRGPVMVRRD